MSRIAPLEFNFIGDQSMISETDYRQEITIRDSADDIIDMSTGWAGKLQIRDDSDTLILEFDSAGASMELSGGDPNLVLIASRTDTNIAAGRYNYDLRLSDNTSDQQIYIRGSFHVIKSITDVI